MKRSLHRLTILALFLLPAALQAQQKTWNAAEIKLGLEKLAVTGRVLYIAAHPDDENTRLLAYLANERKVKTAYLSITRGDGGQNLIGNEQGDLLGLIRTQELLAARRTDGAEQFFTYATDFGFSKNSDETLATWNRDAILKQVVQVIRKFKPDVIITRFPEDSRAGHGHHSSSAILAHEAFALAADPKYDTEMQKEYSTWQAKRLLWNTFNFGGNNTTSEDQLKINVGGYNALLGKSYGEIAAESRSNHKSQGFGSASQRGDAIEYFTHIAGEKASGDLFDGVDLTWKRVKGADAVAADIDAINRNYSISNPPASTQALVELLKKLESLAKGYTVQQKQEDVRQLILQTGGIWLEASLPQPAIVKSETQKVRLQMIKRSDVQVTELPERNKLVTREESMGPEPVSHPYWLKGGSDTTMVQEDDWVGYPENPYPPAINVSLNIYGKVLTYTVPVIYKFTDPVRGEVYQPLVVAPPVTISLENKAYVFSGQARTVTVNLRSFADNLSGKLQPTVPAGWQVSPASVNIAFDKTGEQRSVDFTITPGQDATQGALSFVATTNKGDSFVGLREIAYEHIPRQTLFPPANARLVNMDIQLSGKKIGYIIGAGDLVPEALKQLGYEVTFLNHNDLRSGDLSGYDAIITGVRLYNTDADMKQLQTRLLNYVNNGGVLLVQYNVNSGLTTNDIGPYPFKIARDRVTEEDAEVKINQPSDPALNYPNKIGQEDFEGWVQERGLYFVTDPDAKYSAPISMNDKGEGSNKGSLIVAPYGKGKFVYTSLSFFRQLPAGVPGAYRLFVNLLSKNNPNQ